MSKNVLIPTFRDISVVGNKSDLRNVARMVKQVCFDRHCSEHNSKLKRDRARRMCWVPIAEQKQEHAQARGDGRVCGEGVARSACQGI